MCVARTNRRKRIQIKMDRRYKKKDPVAAARRDAARAASEKARALRKKK